MEIMRTRNHAMIDDERVREVSKCGLIHVPVSITEKIKTGETREGR
jgi:hypothetical protein